MLNLTISRRLHSYLYTFIIKTHVLRPLMWISESVTNAWISHTNACLCADAHNTCRQHRVIIHSHHTGLGDHLRLRVASSAISIVLRTSNAHTFRQRHSFVCCFVSAVFTASNMTYYHRYKYINTLWCIFWMARLVFGLMYHVLSLGLGLCVLDSNTACYS